jgi:hypothetical protein
LARVGAGDCRLLAAEAAGETVGSHIFSIEFESAEAYGIFSDKAAVDPQFEALIDRMSGEDSPVITDFQALITDIPLGTRNGRGRVVQSYVSRPKPGAVEAAIDLSRRAFEFLEQHGAVGTRLFQQSVAGSLTDSLVATVEFESMRMLGRAGDAFLTDPAGRAFGEELAAAGAPITLVTSAIYREVPLD